MSFWRTQTGDEVDFVVYTENEFVSIEVKNAAKPSRGDFVALKLFGKDYPMARRILLYRGKEQYLEQGVLVMPVEKFLLSLRPGERIPGEI